MEHLFAGPDGQGVGAWCPVRVQTRSYDRPVDVVAYDCAKIMLIREGSVRLLSEFGQQIARAGDLIVLCATTLCGAIPQGTVTVSTAYVDPEYLLDQVRWCHAEQLADRMAAEAMVERTFHRRAQLFHLRPHTAELFAKFFDGIESAASRHANPFYAPVTLLAGAAPAERADPIRELARP